MKELDLFTKVSYQCSKIVTQRYSTSFTLGIRMLDRSLRNPIFSIYGFVRFADEIVDSFHDFDKEKLLSEFEKEYYKAYQSGISLNPILHSFQHTVKRYKIDDELIQAFLNSMRSDLHKKEFDSREIDDYIYGSADVVGLMCLKVFVNGDEKRYEELKPHAMRLGSAFQKVNFLRDLNNDVNNLHRVYFPVLRQNDLTDEIKQEIIEEIKEDFRIAVVGIKRLPKTSKIGVYTAYVYYSKLMNRIEKATAQSILEKRIRVPNLIKFGLLGYCILSRKLRLV